MPEWFEPFGIGVGAALALAGAAWKLFRVLDTRREKGDSDIHTRIDDLVKSTATKEDIARVEAQAGVAHQRLEDQLQKMDDRLDKLIDAVLERKGNAG